MNQPSLDLGLPSQSLEWRPTRAAGLDQLNQFVRAAGRQYAGQRNFDFGPGKHSRVSQLSPWIRHRLLLEEEVLGAVMQVHDVHAAEKFVQEVFWRGYFKGWLEHRPDVWRHYKHDLMGLFSRLDTEADLARRYDEATQAKTGLACFDSWTSELIETGYLHNHARMWFASIWIYTFGLPWQLGADFFYRHLVDGDPASNTCSWRWVCGLHTVGKTYLARASNIEKFTNGRFNPVGELAAAAPALEDPRAIQINPPGFTSHDLAGRRVGLIITEEDCSAAPLEAVQPAAILALSGLTERSLKPLGHVAKAFAPSAVQDAKCRAEARFDGPVEDYAGQDWAEAVQDWAGTHQLEACVTARLPQGPVRKRLHTACKTANTDLLEVTRPYDQAIWPHAKRGFFGLKKKIPALLGELDLA
jgi:deoxyribodipyrimidine photo-lyase